MPAIPVVVLTGYLGAGKTSLLNHVLQTPGARIGVIVNDFGDVNLDAALVTGQVDEPVSITGGCVCCLDDDTGLDDALRKLTDPRLALDAIIVEASGLADPVAVFRLIRFSGVERIRPGGVVDVIDAATHFDVVDQGGIPLARYGVASLVVVNKLDQIPADARAALLQRVEDRIRERNSHAHVVGAIGAKIDPALLYDVSHTDEDSGQLTFRELLLESGAHAHDHVHARSVTVTSDGCIDPGALLDVLEDPPAGVYRIKGTVAVRSGQRVRHYVVNVVGTSIHVASAPPGTRTNCLVAIGTHLDVDDTRDRVRAALTPHEGTAAVVGLRRLQRHRRLSL